MSLFGRKAITDASPYVRKIIDLTTPNMTMSHDMRMSRRYNRCLPVVFSPWTSKGHDPKQIGIGITSDLSDYGFSILTQAEMIYNELIVGFYLENEMDVPWYFHAAVRTNRQMIPSFNLVGLEIIEFLNESKRKKTVKFDETVLSLIGTEHRV